MAKVHVLGSSSEGNGYIIETSEGYLLLEAGVNPNAIWKKIGHKRKKVLGCLVSHSHGDHCKYVKNIAERNINIYCNKDVADTKELPADRTWVVTPYKWFSIGNFRVYPFECKHDVPNYGYIIKHPEFEPLLFGTDTYAYPYNFNGIKHYLVEANYSDEILANSDIDTTQRNRLMQSHMSLDYCIKFLEECNAQEADTITLIHLSARHSNADEFQKRVQDEFLVPTYIADKNVIINISKDLV